MSKRVGKRREAERRRIVAELAASGQSVASFARERGLSAWTLYEWRRRLRPREVTAEAGEPDFVQVVVRPEKPAASAMQVELGTGIRVHVPPGFDEGELRRLIEVLSSC